MGIRRSGSDENEENVSDEVNFDHFQILRAIGRGSFGKVCIVQKKNTKRLYAMKYMNKAICIEKDSVKNVLREMELLKALDHPFLVNLWFTFHDVEDMFMVVDLLMGGDLRYHLDQGVIFNEDAMLFYIVEVALALDYLREQRIIHRDLKPDNVLFDEDGHLHITDFNVATVVSDDGTARGFSGTKPYIAPEVFANYAKLDDHYSFSADWWSLGVMAYEIITHQQPWDLRGSAEDCFAILTNTKLALSSKWNQTTHSILRHLLLLDKHQRVDTSDKLREIAPDKIDLVGSLNKWNPAPFVPKKNHLNCDPTFELEEMIIESKPLHKKKKRLAKKSKENPEENNIQDGPLAFIEQNFLPYNREKTKEEENANDNASSS